jgi:membrane protein
MRGKNIWEIVKEASNGWMEHNVSRLAAAVAFYTIFSLAPVLLIALAITGAIMGEASARVELGGQLRSYMGPRASEFILLVVEGTRGDQRTTIATVLASITAFLGATAAFAQLQEGLNTVWDVQPKAGSWLKGLIYSRLFSFLMVLGIGALLLLSLLLTAALSAVNEFVGGIWPAPPVLIALANLGVSFIITTLLFAIIYKVLPDAQISWKDVWVGAALTSLLFTGGKTLIGLYLGGSSLRSAYGAAGSLVVILLWVYYSTHILFFGAELTQAYARRYGKEIRPKPFSERIPWSRLRRGRRDNNAADPDDLA